MTRSLIMVLLLVHGCASSIPQIVQLDEIPAAKVAEAIKKYGIDVEKPAPWTV